VAYQIFIVGSDGQVSRTPILPEPTPEVGDIVRLTIAGRRTRVVVERVSIAVLRDEDHDAIDIVSAKVTDRLSIKDAMDRSKRVLA
jgi:hypothetical protein